MKKSTLLFTTVCLTGAVLLANLSYQGPKDELLPEADYFTYGTFTGNSSLSMLAKFEECGGIGEVIGRGHSEEFNRDFFAVRIDHAFWGCTNGQILHVGEIEKKTRISASNQVVDLYPTNHARIVFAVSTNIVYLYPNELDVFNWNHEAHLFPIEETAPLFVLNRFTRAWWYEDYQGGHLTTYLTNAFHTMHTHRNWTNYYEVCRNGASINSNRVKEDSFFDLRSLITRGTDEEIEFMDNDPLFPANNRPFLDAEIAERQQKK